MLARSIPSLYRGTRFEPWQVRIDIAVVKGALHGFEIKSDFDNLKRLARQVDLYSQVLDRATLVVGERFAPRAPSAMVFGAFASVSEMRKA